MGRLSAGYELLGKLGNDLRDLTGFDTLVYELTQNADDAPDATRVRFDITTKALTVWNDGTFTDCGHQESPECPRVELDGELVRCDFHSFRLISGHAKRGKAGTTGAFGIGFTSVFQITDYPELLSGGRHWILRYDEPEDQNIEVCEGCSRDHNGPGTTFVLPWARDASSRVRKGLRFEPVGRAVEQRFAKAAAQCLPSALIFLRRVRRVDVVRDGEEIVGLGRSDIPPWRYLEDGSADTTFYVLTGDFEEEASELRRRFSRVLGEDVREAVATIAIPTELGTERLPLHAVLPTLETTPLEYHLSSSFFPSQNRKRLKFEAEADGESEWNRAAIRAGAQLVARAVESLASDLGAAHLWSIIRSSYELADTVETAPDSVFACFWDELVEQIPDARVVWTACDEWLRPADVVLLERRWEPAIDSLHELAISVVHPEISPAVFPVSSEVGIERLDASRLAESIREAGLREAVPLQHLPGVLAGDESLNSLIAVIADLASEIAGDDRVDDFDGCAVIPCVGGVAAPPEKVALASEESVALFRALKGVHFADVQRISEVAPALDRLLAPLAAEDIVSALGDVHEAGELGQWLANVDIRDVLRWFAGRAEELDNWDIAALRSLPLYPTSKGLRPLGEIQLPGSFERDPLGIAETVDLTGIEALRGFLGDECLGATTLSLEVYLRELLAPAFEDGGKFGDAALDSLLGILASSLEELVDADLDLLSQLPIVPTSGGRAPALHAYFDTEEVRKVLGKPVIVSIPSRQRRGMKSLFEALGVATEPRADDIVEAVKRVVSGRKTKAAIARVRAVIEYLGPRFRFGPKTEEEDAREALQAEFSEFLELEWLPVVGGEWRRPDEVYRTDWRTAFETTGTFIELPDKTVQMPNADFLELLGVHLRPEPELVVAHLLNCVERRKPVAKRAYQALDDADVDDLAELREKSCVLVSRDPVRYVSPVRVVRDPGPLRGYVEALPSELTSFSRFSEAVEIADGPEIRHAIEVLRRVGDTYEHERDFGAIQACWRILDEAFDECATDDELFHLQSLIGLELASVASWPDRIGDLQRPGGLFIDDLPALRDFIPDAVQRLLVDSPRSGARALREAGLEFLSEAVSEEIVAVPNAVSDAALIGLLRDREEALARLLAWAGLGLEKLDELSEFDILAVDDIVVHREIERSGIDLGNHSVSAHLDEAGLRLFVRQLGVPAWTEIAVELTRLLCGPGQAFRAATIADVLEAGSASEAHAHLDTLQIPRLDPELQEKFEAEDPGMSLFDEEFTVDEPEAEWDAEAEAELEDDEEAVLSSPPFAAPITDGDESEAAVADEASDDSTVELGTESSHISRRPPTGFEPSVRREVDGSSNGSIGPSGAGRGAAPGTGAHAGAGAGNSGKGAAREAKPTIPWRVWVSGGSGKDQDARAANEANSEFRDEVSRRGVERALKYEADHGRLAAEMPPGHPGYDIESTAGRGRPPARLIEVKALAGTWEAEWSTAGNPPQLTAEQFRMSMDEGRHWLYVVENALNDDLWAIYPLQAVGQRANRYLFDHGWKEAALRPFGPGADRGADFELAAPPKLPDAAKAVFGADLRDVGDVPFVALHEVGRVGRLGVEDDHDRWFTAKVVVQEGDFAIQQVEAAMGSSLPLGAIGVFRPGDGAISNGSVVIADIAGGHEQPQFAIRRSYVVRDDAGQVEGLHLRVDVPGCGDDYEFHDPHAAGRIAAQLVDFQAL